MGVVARLASSPRKGEYVNVMVDGKPMRTWVVRPAGNGKAPVVVVIMEIFGLSDWIRGVADQLAAEGFIAVAPDIVVGHGKDGGDTSSLSTQQEITQAVLQVPAAEITAKLKAAREWGLKDPRSSGKSASVGFCFGGAQSFAFAVNESGRHAARSIRSVRTGGLRQGADHRFLWRADAGSAHRQHGRADRNENEGARQGIRATYLRRRGARLPPRADRQRWRQYE